MIATKGRARQKTMTLAKKAGIQVNAVVFTRPELIKALGYDPGKRYGTKRDTAWGRCFIDAKVIWFSLPVSLSTIAHELAHLATKVSHNTDSFNVKMVAIQRGLNPAQHKPQWYEVTVTTVAKYKVRELSASEAKKHYRNTPFLRQTQTIKARKVEV